MFKIVHYQMIQLASDEWGSDLMRKVAKEWLQNNRQLLVGLFDGGSVENFVVEVWEHGGWWLYYTLDNDGRTMIVASANDEARYPERAARWREQSIGARWQAVSHTILRGKAGVP